MYNTGYSYPILMKLDFLNKFSKKNQTPNFMKIRPVGTKLFHENRQTDRQTYMTQLTVRFFEMFWTRLLHNSVSFERYRVAQKLSMNRVGNKIFLFYPCKNVCNVNDVSGIIYMIYLEEKRLEW